MTTEEKVWKRLTQLLTLGEDFIPLKQQEIASDIGVNSGTVSVAIHKLKEKGRIEVKQGERMVRLYKLTGKGPADDKPLKFEDLEDAIEEYQEEEWKHRRKTSPKEDNCAAMERELTIAKAKLEVYEALSALFLKYLAK
jgi:DNA-binding MarR family transcriptional regulator